MVKLRDAGYCNLKLFLIYLVVYGHLLEPQIGSSEATRLQYQWIYAFHMPLFAFLSGLFLRRESDCRRQLSRLLPLYGFLQTMAALLLPQVRMDTPWWYLWYLLSACCWTALAWLWFRLGKRWGGGFAILWVILGCLAGREPRLEKVWSLSRTVVFLPYFWVGLLCSPERALSGYRPAGWLALVLGTGMVWLHRKLLRPSLLYQTGPAEPAMRLLCYGIGALFCFAFLCLVPRRRFPFTRIGADTLPAYLFQGPLVLMLWEAKLPWGTLALLTAGYLWFLYKLLQWGSTPCGITPEERRDRPWPRSQTFMKNMPGLCTDSSSP